jgi:hypothetical protein
VPFGPEVRVGARAHLRTGLWAVGGVAVCVALLSGAINARTALALLLVSGLVELLMRGASALGALRARLPGCQPANEPQGGDHSARPGETLALIPEEHL